MFESRYENGGFEFIAAPIGGVRMSAVTFPVKPDSKTNGGQTGAQF